MTIATAATGTGVITADGTAPVTGIRRALRRAALWLACAAVVASSVSGCKSVDPGVPAAVPASRAAKAPARTPADPACPQALEAISTYGPAVVRNAVADKESLDKAEIDLIVIVLSEAANSAGSSGVKQSIISLVGAYLTLRDSLSTTIDSAIEKKIEANTSDLNSECGSSRPADAR
ncbi:MAG TPA: hypothetical protein VMG13_04145 [Trebonia sp.]|nr:hypothetical protein [Trebonia sp.]